MAVSVFLLHSDPERSVSGVGRGRGGPCSQSVSDVFSRARPDWLAVTSCCSSGWGQSRRGRLLQRPRGRVTMVFVAAAADSEHKPWRRESKGSSLTIFSCPCASCGSLGKAPRGTLRMGL
nr:uncharacterized protein LOC110146578 [Odocoileus virginianus texanus]